MRKIGHGFAEFETVRVERPDGSVPLLKTKALHTEQRDKAEPDGDTSGIAVCRVHTPDLGVALEVVALVDAYGICP